MAQKILTIGSGGMASDPFTVGAGESATIIPRAGPAPVAPDTGSAPVRVGVEIRNADNGWSPIGAVDAVSVHRVIAAPGTYRLTRSSLNIGADVEMGSA